MVVLLYFSISERGTHLLKFSKFYTGDYHVPYDGLYQVTIAHQGNNDNDLVFRIRIDGVKSGFCKNSDSNEGGNTVICTHNFHLLAGQVVKSDYDDMDSVYASSHGVIGYESWFSVHLILPD